MVEDRSGLIKGAGLFVGILIGAITGPVLLRPTGLNDPSSSAIGTGVGPCSATHSRPRWFCFGEGGATVNSRLRPTRSCAKPGSRRVS